MLARARDLMASDPRDKIFALLGISTGFESQAEGLIDYGVKTEESYTNFAVRFMRATGDYTLLSYLNKGSTMVSLNRRLQSLQKERDRYQDMEYKDVEVQDQKLYRQMVSHEPENAVLDARSLQARKNSDNSMDSAQICRAEMEVLRTYQETCGGTMKDLDLPSWVPDWQCILSSTYEPLALTEVLPVSTSPLLHNVENFRAFYPRLRSVPTASLVVHGRVLGRVSKLISLASCLGRDEAAFEALKSQWHRQASYQQYPMDAQILTTWAHFLDATAATEDDIALAKRGNTYTTSIELARRRGYDMGHILSKPPGSQYPGRYAPVSFLDYMDVATIPPAEGSIEQHLVAPAHRTAPPSGHPSPATVILRDRASIIDRRSVGVFERMRLAPSRVDAGSLAIGGADLRDVKSAAPHAPCLLLLPENANFMDLVVYFPGARVPFVLRPNVTEDIMSCSAERSLTTGALPFLDCSEWYAECKMIGECWVNDFDAMV